MPEELIRSSFRSPIALQSNSRCPTRSPCMRLFSLLSHYQHVLISLSYPLSNFTFRCVSNLPYRSLFRILGEPDTLTRPIVPKRRNLKRIHLSQLVYSVSKITTRTLACAGQSRVSSSFMIMDIHTSSCSKLPTHSSSCMLCLLSTFSKFSRNPQSW